MGDIRDGRGSGGGQPHGPAVRRGVDQNRRDRPIGRAPNRAAQTLALFGTVLVASILLAIPDQAYGVLGGELIALALLLAVGLVALDRRARSETAAAGTHAIGQELEAVAPNGVTAILSLVSGLLLAVGVHAGLYVVVLPLIAALVGGVVSAWLLLTKLPVSSP